MKFIWDARKAQRNFWKHGVSFEEARTVFDDVLALTIHDVGHSSLEIRLLTIGVSSSGRLLVVSHTDRDDVLRIISARRATVHERKAYEG